ncbi:MAG: hypothetical protein LBF33_03340 [Oscillospiraceae bacterium]|nr:hypothetical protein [Oscillospiraceae bacterium]
MSEKKIKLGNFNFSNFKEKSKSKNKIWIIISCICVSLCVLFLLSLYLMTKDNYADKFDNKTSQNFDVFFRFITAASLDEEVSIKFSEIDSFLNPLLNQYNSSSNDKLGFLERLNFITASHINNGEKAFKIYLSVTFGNMHLSFIVDTKLRLLEDKSAICFDVNRTQIGQMPIPRKLLLHFAKSKFPANWKIEDTKILVPSCLQLNFLNSNLNFDIKKLEVLEDEIVLRTSSNKQHLGDFITDQLKNFIFRNTKHLSCKLV